MKKLGRYLILFTLAILTISAIVTASIVYTAHASSNAPAQTTTINMPLTTKTVQLFTNQTINQGQTLKSSFTSTVGYKRAALYISEVNSPNMDATGLFSIDGVNAYNNTGQAASYINSFTSIQGGGFPVGQTEYFMATDDVSGPYLAVSLYNSTNSSYPTSATFSVTLYLMP